MCDYLLNIYKEVFDQDFHYSDFNERMEMQKSIYLLENMGLDIGGYGFIWYKHGPYSQRLQDEAYNCMNKSAVNVIFTEFAKGKIAELKDYINKGKTTKYETPYWLEAIASIDFMINRQFMTDVDVLNELKIRKPHLNSDVDNELALAICRKMRNAVA